jgi:MFS family permease
MSAIVDKPIPHSRWIRIIPAVVIVYIIAYMDRVNIGFAIAGGMNEALGLSFAAAGFAAGIYSWGYLLLQVPGGHIAEHGSAKKFVLWTIVGWGGISFLTGFVQNSWQLYAMRFLLGVAEGGVYPAILVIIGKWFPQRELGRANALFTCSLPLSAAITNPISGWIVSHYNWRGLFFFEGVVSLALIAIWLPFISDCPEEAKWITKEEKEYLLTTLAADKAQREKNFKAAGGAKWSYLDLLKNPYLWVMSTVYACYSAGTIAFIIWLPTLLKRITKMSLTNVGWLSTLPLAGALLGLFLFGTVSDRRGNRRLWGALGLLCFGTFLWLATFFTAHIWVCYAFLLVAGLFSKSMMGPFWSMPSLVFPPGVAGGARGIINAIGAGGGGFIGPVLVGWLMAKTGNMNYGIYSLAGILIFGGCVMMLMPKVTAGYKYQAQAKAATKATSKAG